MNYSKESHDHHDHGFHSHNHHHHHHDSLDDKSGKKLILTFILNFIIALTEAVGGVVSGSLSLLSDAVHNLSDSISLLIAYIARRYARKKANKQNTYGYKRIEILTAMFNAVTLIAVCIFLIYHAVERFYSPVVISAGLMFVVAVVGFLANFISILILFNEKKKDLNIRAAYLHLLGDTLSSVAVILTSGLIYYFQLFWADALITIIIALYIIKETYEVLRNVYQILMQATPEGISIDEIKKDIEKIEDISNIHHVHVWNLSDSDIHFECHIELGKDLNISAANKITAEIEELLEHKYEIHHSTLQLEYNCSHSKEVIANH